MTALNGVADGRSLAELDAIIKEATAQKAQMYDAELERLVAETSARCEVLGITPAQLMKMFKRPRGRPRSKKSDESA